MPDREHSHQQILVVGPSWVGDMVMAQSLFMHLKASYRQAVIDVVAPAWSLPLIERMPEVRTGIALHAGHGQLRLRDRWRLAKQLQQTGYDWAITLPRSFKSALVPFWAGISKRTGYRGEYRYGLLNDIRTMHAELDQTVKRFVALGLDKASMLDDFSKPQPRLRTSIDNTEAVIKQLGLSNEKPAVALMPGAEYGPAKQWPLDHFAELAKAFADKGWQVWILGSAKDAEAGEQIKQLCGGVADNLCGQTKLQDAIDLIGKAKLAVSNDSGLMHIAAAVACPLVAVYGSSSPGFTPPLTEQAAILYKGLDCSPCFKRDCPYGHYNCLHEITVEDVLTAGMQQLV